MNFEAAIIEVRAAHKVARVSWSTGQYAFRDPKNSALPGTPGYLSLQTPQGNVQGGWVPSQEDKDADDWYVLG